MTIRPAMLYLARQSRNSLLIFYAVMLILYALIGSLVVVDAGGSVRISGTDNASFVFIFIVGIASFRENFHMFLQNGLSRKTLFIGSSLTILAISALMSLIDAVFSFVLSRFITFDSFFTMVYGMGSEAAGLVPGIFWRLFVYCALGLVGLFIGALYYRMSKGVKILVSVGVPVFFFIVLPLLDYYLTGIKLYAGIFDLLSFCLGFSEGGGPGYAMVFFAALSLLTGLFTWLVLRRTEIKA